MTSGLFAWPARVARVGSRGALSPFFKTLWLTQVPSSDMNSPNQHDSNSTADASLERQEGPYVGLTDPNEFKAPKPTPRFIVSNTHLRECLAEFLGTLVMILFGMGVNNQVTISKDSNGSWLSINMCWGVAVMLGVHVSEGISGAHLNPAVTISMATYNRLPWRKVPGYILAQFLGSFIGAAAIFAMYKDLLNVVDPHRTTTRSSFSTYPHKDVTNLTAFYTEFLATATLLIGVFAITDKRNRPASPFGTPMHFMVLIWAIGMAFGMNTGYAINPARDFGPRLFTSMAGWGSAVFTLRNYYFWIPIVAPPLGGIVGGGIYKLFVEMHHPQQSELPI